MRKHFYYYFLFVLFIVFLVFFGFYCFVFNGCGSFLLVFWLFNGFLWFYNGFEQFLIGFIGFPYGFALFWVYPLWFFMIFVGSRIGSERKTKGKLLENHSQPTPGPLRSFLLGLSLLCLSLLRGSFSGTSPESLLVVWPPLGSSGWLWPPPC